MYVMSDEVILWCCIEIFLITIDCKYIQEYLDGVISQHDNEDDMVCDNLTVEEYYLCHKLWINFSKYFANLKGLSGQGLLEEWCILVFGVGETCGHSRRMMSDNRKLLTLS